MRFVCSVVAAGILVPLAGASHAAQGVRVDSGVAPLIGTAYSHWAIRGCSPNGTGIVATYDQPGVRGRVRLQLAAMRAAGIESLRLLLWHATDTSGQDWGIVPSAGGRLGEPYRSNLINYLSDVRAADFKTFTLDFGPEGSNDPTNDAYDPTKFDENWRFIRDVRPLVKQYGPPITRIDLLSEGAPSSYLPESLPQIQAYISAIYRHYVDAFGNSDVAVSAIAPPDPYEDITQPDSSHCLQNLIDAFTASGRSQPTFFSVHVTTAWHPSAQNTLYGLQQTDATLTANGLAQPLIISETAYDNMELARAIAEFRRTSSRPILEVQEWPWRAGSACKDFSVSPPFRASAYISALTHSPPPSTITASLMSHTINLQTSQHDPAVALEAGRYRIVVRDAAPHTGLRVTGPGLNKKTGAQFQGTLAWSVRLRAGTYSFQSSPPQPRLRRRIVVLSPG